MKKHIMALLLGIVMLFHSVGAGAEGVFHLKFFGQHTISLMYHKLSKNPEDHSAYCISPEAFEEDIRYLKEHGYSFCTASEAIRTDTQRKRVFITFDDGYESDYLYALPILEKYNAKATFFVIGSNIGIHDHITIEHLYMLAQSPLVEIGSHSYDLHNHNVDTIKDFFYNDNIEMLVDDFQKNATFLGNITKKPVATLSYPNGIWTDETDDALRKAGFTATFTSDEKNITGKNTPCGRFNRSLDRTAQYIVEREK